MYIHTTARARSWVDIAGLKLILCCLYMLTSQYLARHHDSGRVLFGGKLEALGFPFRTTSCMVGKADSFSGFPSTDSCKIPSTLPKTKIETGC